MLKIFLTAILGILFIIVGVVIGLYYLKNIDSGVSVSLLILALFVVIVGIYLLFQGAKSDESLMFNSKISSEDMYSTKNKIGIIEKNNAITQEWLASNEKKEKLRLLKMISAEEENSTKTTLS
ncbi:MAG: hypothetical protein ABIO02_03655 [Patescibacteria group bacterium]